MATWTTMMQVEGGDVYGWFLILNVPDLVSGEQVMEAVRRSGFLEPNWSDAVGEMWVEPIEACSDCMGNVLKIDYRALVAGRTRRLARQMKAVDQYAH